MVATTAARVKRLDDVPGPAGLTAAERRSLRFWATLTARTPWPRDVLEGHEPALAPRATARFVDEVLPALRAWFYGDAMRYPPGTELPATLSGIDTRPRADDPARTRALVACVRRAAAVLAPPRVAGSWRLYRFVRVPRRSLAAPPAALVGRRWRTGHAPVQSWSATLDAARDYGRVQYPAPTSPDFYGFVVAAEVPAAHVLLTAAECVAGLHALGERWLRAGDGAARRALAAFETAHTIDADYADQREVIVDLPRGVARVAAVHVVRRGWAP